MWLDVVQVGVFTMRKPASWVRGSAPGRHQQASSKNRFLSSSRRCSWRWHHLDTRAEALRRAGGRHAPLIGDREAIFYTSPEALRASRSSRALAITPSGALALRQTPSETIYPSAVADCRARCARASALRREVRSFLRRRLRSPLGSTSPGYPNRTVGTPARASLASVKENG